MIKRSDRAGSPAPLSSDPSDLVRRWVDLAIITDEQAAAIRADQALSGPMISPDEEARMNGPPGPSGRGSGAGGVHTSLIAEALGYLGGALILAACGLAVGRFWGDLGTGVRLVMAAAAAGGVLLAGAAVPTAAGAIGVRLRSVLWLAASALFAGFLALLGDEVVGWRDAGLVVFVAIGTSAACALLWWRHHHVLQHLATAAALVAAVASVTALILDSETAPAASVWALGIAWYLLAQVRLLRPRREAELVGAAVTAGATLFFAAETWGSPLALATLVAMAVLAVGRHDLPLLGFGAITTLLAIRRPGPLDASHSS